MLLSIVMNAEESPRYNPEDLYPYLNRAYWDGHMIGDGEPAPEPDADTYVGPQFGYSRFAAKSLRAYLENGSRYFPLTRFSTGEVFNPNDWNPGTIVLFDRESLTAHSVPEGFDAAEYEGLPLPAKPTNLSPQIVRYGNYVKTSTIYKDEAAGLQYMRSLRWGVVMPPRDGRQGLHQIPSFGVLEGSQGRIVTAAFLTEEVPIRIGAVRPGNDFLRRTNALEVCSYGGTPESSKNWLAKLVSRLAVHGA